MAKCLPTLADRADAWQGGEVVEGGEEEGGAEAPDVHPETPAEQDVEKQLTAALSLWNDKRCARTPPRRGAARGCAVGRRHEGSGHCIWAGCFLPTCCTV